MDEKKKCKRSADRMLDLIIAGVYSEEWPAAWPRDEAIGCVLSEAKLEEVFLTTTEMDLDNAQFQQCLATIIDREKVRELVESDSLKDLWSATDSACAGRLAESETHGLAYGFAAGLRAAGLARREAKLLLRQFLNKYLPEE